MLIVPVKHVPNTTIPTPPADATEMEVDHNGHRRWPVQTHGPCKTRRGISGYSWKNNPSQDLFSLLQYSLSSTEYSSSFGLAVAEDNMAYGRAEGSGNQGWVEFLATVWASWSPLLAVSPDPLPAGFSSLTCEH